MNKKLLVVGIGALLSIASYSQEIRSSIGLGVGGSLSPYQGVGTVGSPIPIVNVEYGDFYLKSGDVRYSVLSVGYNFYSNESLVLSAYINPMGGFDVDRSEMDKGYGNIDSRDYQFEGGLKAVYDTGWHNVKLQAHGTYGEEGGHVGGSAFKPIRVTEKFTLVPRVTFTYFEEDYVDYYFGVTQSEADRNSNITKSYDPDGAFAYGFDLAANYDLKENISLIAFAGVEKFSSDVDDSPIVEEDVLYKVGVGATYRF